MTTKLLTINFAISRSYCRYVRPQKTAFGTKSISSLPHAKNHPQKRIFYFYCRLAISESFRGLFVACDVFACYFSWLFRVPFSVSKDSVCAFLLALPGPRFGQILLVLALEKLGTQKPTQNPQKIPPKNAFARTFSKSWRQLLPSSL